MSKVHPMRLMGRVMQALMFSLNIVVSSEFLIYKRQKVPILFLRLLEACECCSPLSCKDLLQCLCNL
jgi:hypothetical protein